MTSAAADTALVGARSSVLPLRAGTVLVDSRSLETTNQKEQP